MAAKRNPKTDEAYKLYKGGMRLVEIAVKLGVPDGTVRRWKSTYKWDGERSVKEYGKKANVRKKSEQKKKKAIDDGTKDTLKNTELTSEQQMFCIYYSRTFNAAQSYQKAYGCSYNSALCAGSRLLGNVNVREEIERLKELKRQQIVAMEEDFVELQMRIAFSDVADVVEIDKVLGCIPKNLKQIDTQIVRSIKNGANGIVIEMEDRQKAIVWLDEHFMNNPMDIHKTEYDKKKLELEYLKLESTIQAIQADDVADAELEDNFLDALNASAKDVWSSE